MLTADDISHLIEPVLYRAQAKRTHPRLRLSDQWAEFVLDKLEVAPFLRHSVQRDSSKYKMALQRCKWIDQQLLQFVTANPTAVIVELFAGLSTRFHRVSHGSDWPQFRWVAVDEFEVAECIKYVFPTLDNHARVVAEKGNSAWMRQINRPGKPTPMVVLDDEHHPASLSDIMHLLTDLQEHTLERCSPVHVLVTHKVEALAEQLSKLPVEVVAEFQTLEAPRTVWRSYARRLLSLVRTANWVQTTHLSLAPSSKGVQQ